VTARRPRRPRRARRALPRRDERGLTLADLLVYSALLTILLPLAGVLLHGAVSSQRDVQSVTQAGDVVQTAVRSVEIGIRSAAAVYPVTAPAAGTELIVARRPVGPAGSVTTWVCQGWYYADGVLYTRRVDAAGATAPAITTANLSQWSVLASGIAPRVAGSRVFTTTASGATTTVGVDLAVAAGGKQVAVMSTAVTTRPQGQTGGHPCF
jgi:hypothetical protein